MAARYPEHIRRAALEKKGFRPRNAANIVEKQNRDYALKVMGVITIRHPLPYDDDALPFQNPLGTIDQRRRHSRVHNDS